MKDERLHYNPNSVESEIKTFRHHYFKCQLTGRMPTMLVSNGFTTALLHIHQADQQEI